MSVEEISRKPTAFAHFPDEPYRYLRIHDATGEYGHAALAERGDDLELHVSLSRWGPGVRRSLRRDAAWLEDEARRLGKRRIVGMRLDSRGELDPRLFRFAAMFGFTQQCVVQTAAKTVAE